jgi:hypothetical protein
MTNSDSNHQKWDRSSSSSAGSIPSHPRIRLNLWLFAKPINLPDRGVDIGRIPRHFPRRESAAEFPCCWPLLAITHMCMLYWACITVSEVPERWQREDMHYAQCGRHPSSPRVEDDSSGEHPVWHTVLTHQPLQDYNARRAGRAASFPCASVVLQRRVRRLSLSVVVAYARLPLPES